MCERSTCFPTPAQAKRLIDRGYGARLAHYHFLEGSFVAPALQGYSGRHMRLSIGARCTFFVDGKCELHDSDLKPLEGRIAHHDRDPGLVRAHIMKFWKNDDYVRIARLI